MDPETSDRLTDSPPSAQRIKARWKVLGCLGMAVVLFVVFILLALQAARGEAERMVSTMNIKQIGQALHNYHDTNGTFPPAYIADEEGRPMHSWRVLILPFVGEQTLYDRYDFNKPWDHPDNAEVTSQMPEIYASRHTRFFGLVKIAPDGYTHYQAISAPNTVLGTTEGSRVEDISSKLYGTTVALENFSRPVHWADPTDLAPDEILANFQQITAGPSGGSQAVMVDGSIIMISPDTSPEELEAGFYINDGQGFRP